MQQSQLFPLTHESDVISQQLAPEAATTLTTNLVTLKGELGKLTDAARAEMNTLTDFIVAR